MGTRERDEQAEEQRERQEQERMQQQDRNTSQRALLDEGDNDTTTNPVIINK
jgi:hypothetical protein